MMRRAVSLAAIAALAVFVAARSPAVAHSYKFGDIEVGHLWGPPTSGTETDIFGPLFNSGEEADALVSASSPEAKGVTVRNGPGEQASANFRIELPPGEPVSLAPWGIHLRLIGLSRTVKEGDWVPITLVFEKAGEHDAKILIEKSPSD